MKDLDKIPIETLKLSRRTKHLLLRTRIITVGDLKMFIQHNNLLQIRQIGENSVNEINNVLDAYKDFSSQGEEKEISSNQPFIPGEVVNKIAIDSVNLPKSILNPLKRIGIKTIGDLGNTPESVIRNINRIGPKSFAVVKQILADVLSDPSNYIIEEPAKVEKEQLNWAQLVQSYFESEKETYVFVMLSRYGVKPKTLEVIASELGVTRERVRQIQEAAVIRFLNYMRLEAGATELLGKVSGILSFYGKDLSLKKFRETLKKEDILGEFSPSFVSERISKVDPFEALICWLTLLTNSKYSLEPVVFPIDINALINFKNVSINDFEILENISSKIRKKIKRKMYFTGGINIKDAIAILSANEKIATLVLQDLNFRKLDKFWYVLKTYDANEDGTKIPLRGAGLKILAATPEVELSVFCDGLRRHISRFYSSLAPNEVIVYTLKVLGFDVDTNGQVSTKLSLNNNFSRSEKSIISIMTKNDGVASFLEIAEEFFLHNLSLPAVSVTLKRSPIVEKVDEGLYKLRGAKISWQQIETAKKRQKSFSQDDEIIHGLDGIVRVRLTVNNYAYLTGVVGSYNIIGLTGSWPIVSNNEFFGDARMDESYLWGLSKIFKKLEKFINNMFIICSL